MSPPGPQANTNIITDVLPATRESRYSPNEQSNTIERSVIPEPPSMLRSSSSLSSPRIERTISVNAPNHPNSASYNTCVLDAVIYLEAFGCTSPNSGGSLSVVSPSTPFPCLTPRSTHTRLEAQTQTLGIIEAPLVHEIHTHGRKEAENDLGSFWDESSREYTFSGKSDDREGSILRYAFSVPAIWQPVRPK